MNSNIQTKLSSIFVLILLLTLTGCSVVDSYRTPSRPAATSLPKIPEIKRQQAVKPRYVPPKKAVVRSPVKPRAQISSSSYQIKNKPIVVKPTKPKLTDQQKAEAKLRIQEQAKQKATVEIDPYASIPDSSNNSVKVVPNNAKPTSILSSPAVKTLMTSARADIAIGRSRSAISKLERGLRIEPENAQLWHMLAKAHYSNSAYLHSISIAKKSNTNTNDDELIKQNWQLIKKAGERSGNADAIKEALDYMKLNP